MVPQIDILRCANMLLNSYGFDEATYRASSRASACGDQGDVDGQQVWGQIVAAIKEMATTKAPTALVH